MKILHRNEALFLLGFPCTAEALERSVNPTPEQVQAAFIARVKETHPDALHGGGDVDLDRLKMARDLLRQNVTTTENACQQCNGHGRVPSRMGTALCGACKGSGETTL